VRRVLFIGDIVGRPGLDLACERVPALRDERGIDIVVANAENAADDGHGLSPEGLDRLLGAGVDVVTGGNHSWDRPEVLGHARVIRPLNVPQRYAGRGVLTLDGTDRPFTVVNVGDRDALTATPSAPDEVTDVLAAVEGVLDAGDRGDVLVDVHAEHVYTKQSLAHALDGRVSAVVGTHTHEPTLRMRRLPGGTGLVTEVGMTGCPDGVMGFTAEAFVRGLRTGAVLDGRSVPTTTAPPELSAVLLDIDEEGSVRELDRAA
jgi:metallophosphoesterase (TIGR00282 family)